VGLLPVAAAPAPAVEAGRRCETKPEEAAWKSVVDPELRGIYESDLRPIPVACVELVEVIVASVSSMCLSNRFCPLCLSFSTKAETKLRQQSAERKVDYRD
jgi:hypothetical protein